MKWGMAISVCLFFSFLLSSPLWGAPAPGGEDAVSGTGEIVFVKLEGGFFGIVSDDGQRFDPMNLDAAFRVSGLKVRFSGKLRKNVIGIHMWGKPLELLKIEKLTP